MGRILRRCSSKWFWPYHIRRHQDAGIAARAQKALGEQFSLRDFHDEVLRDGAMPLAVLEEKMERWIMQRKTT